MGYSSTGSSHIDNYQDYIKAQEDGSIYIKIHPIFTVLVKVSYSHKSQATGNWNNITTICRGHIINSKTGKYIARPFDKFFNLNEVEETKENNLDWSTARIYEKYDGVMIIVNKFNGDIMYSTRNSFDNEQIDEVIAISKEYNYHSSLMEKLQDDETIMFELISPKFRIVENYGDTRDLICIGLRNSTGDLLDYSSLRNRFPEFQYPEEYTPSAILDFLHREQDKEMIDEGFVVHVKTISGKPLLVKVKRHRYIKVSNILSGVNHNLFTNLIHGKETGLLVIYRDFDKAVSVARKYREDPSSVSEQDRIYYEGGKRALDYYFSDLPLELKKDVVEQINTMEIQYDSIIARIQQLNNDFSRISNKEIAMRNDVGILYKNWIFTLRAEKLDELEKSIYKHIIKIQYK